MNLIEIFSIITIHWFADFVMQDEKWALGKSKNWKDLLSHTITYSLIFGFTMCFMLPVNKPSIGIYLPTIFFCITFIAHTITDYFTSRIVSKRFENKHYGSAIPNFGAFSIIGFDQVLHYIQLFITYKLLT